MKKIIIVGSAPLGRDYSDFIDSSDYVVRFNECKNYGGNSGTKTDILVLNNSGDPDTMHTLRLMLKPRTAKEIAHDFPYLSNVKEIQFVRPPAEFLVKFIETRVQPGPLREIELKALRPDRDLAAEIAKSLRIDQKIIRPLPSEEFYASVWDRLLSFGPTEAYAPSTGIMGIEMILSDPRFTAYQKFIVGFGWKMWKGHPGWLERQLALQHVDQGRMKHLSYRRAVISRWARKLFR